MMTGTTDTIAAIATALSDSGIGIIRISGEEAISIGDKIFYGKKRLKDVKTHTIHYGYISELTGGQDSPNEEWKKQILDEVLVSVMKAPNSYTAEDTVEINCHGGVFVIKKVLELVLKSGARLAEPGEFSKRAFLNGKMDLSKAEAVMDLIHAKNEYAFQASLSQLKGNLQNRIRQIRDKILYEVAFIEAALDDPEHISIEGYGQKLHETNLVIIEQLKDLLSTASNGRLMKEGISTVIVGKPNVGKSSLLNFLTGEERAIVTDIAGTTRDVLQETVNLNGISLNVIDTAGIRDTKDIVEKIGVDKAKEYAKDADLVIYVVDSSVDLDENDRNIIAMIGDKNTIILLNKTDLKTVVDEEKLEHCINDILPDHGKVKMIRTSIKESEGMEVFGKYIEELFFEGKLKSNDQIVITSLRYKEALQGALDSLYLVEKSIEDEMPEDFYSIDLMSAYTLLGTITGEEVNDDLVEEIFSKFCMGK